MKHPRVDTKNREIPYATDGQRYACVTDLLGDCRVMVAPDNDEDEKMRCTIRGKFRKRVYIRKGDWVLVGSCGQVIEKYGPVEVQHLKRIGEIKDSVDLGGRGDDTAADQYISFGDDDHSPDVLDI